MGIFRLRRKEQPWEVVENRCIDPVPVYFEDGDLDLVSMGDEMIRGTYTFELRPPQTGKHFRSAVQFARQRLLQAGAKKGFNNLLMESWNVTLYRKGQQHRIEVDYTAYPALNRRPHNRVPPFIALLD